MALRYVAAPLLVMVLSLATFELISFDMPHTSDALATSVLDGQALRENRPIVEARARVLWATSVLVFAFTLASVLCYSINVVVRFLSRHGLVLYVGVAGVTCLMLLGHLVYSGLSRNAFSYIFYFTFDNLEHCRCFEASELRAIELTVMIVNVLAAVVPPVGLIAACTCVAERRGDRGLALDSIQGQMRRLRGFLNAGSALLVTGIVHQLMWMRWPAALVGDNVVAGDITTFAESISTYWGATYSLLVLSYYGPMALHLNRRARALIAQSPEAIGDLDPEEWLARHRLSIAPMQQIPQVVAVLGPLVVGPMGSVFGDVGRAMIAG